MADCIHCGTPFSTKQADDKFCCKGCEFVYELIHEEGLDRYYTLRQDSPLKPVRSVPFESHDFTWLKESVEEIEAKAAPVKTVEADFSLEGISCIGCVWLVEKIFLRNPGAIEAAAHPATGRVHLSWVAGEMNLPAFAQELVSFGYTLSPRRAGNAASEAGAIGARLGLCGAFMLNAMGFTLPSYLGMPPDFAFAGLFQLVGLLTVTLSMLVGGSYFITRAWKAAQMRTLHIDLPIALGLVIAFIGSIIGWSMEIHGLMYFDFVSTFVFLMLGGRYLQLAAMEKNRQRLQRHRPIPETLRSPDRVERVHLDELIAGLRFELEPGQSSPVAAVLEQATADFSLEWINGEAESCNFSAGRPVPAGAIYLGKLPVVLTASETWGDSMLAKLVLSDRPSVRVPALEKLLKYYLFAVLVVGVAGFLFWNQQQGISRALQVMISVFVVSCPCALGVSLPMADEISGSMMERLGVFIRQPLLWARLRRVKTVVFDKTGTLTLERPVLMNPEVIATLTPDSRLALARLASGSLHPVSRSLLESLGREGQILLRGHSSISIEDIPGSGRCYDENGDAWSLGKPGWRSGKDHRGASSHDAELVKNGQPIARFLFQESLRAEAIASLALLKKLNYRLVILSGDREAKVSSAALTLGIPASDTHASLQPGEKEALVRQIDQQDTLYLGDGANDSLAFNAAWTTGTPVVDRSLLEAKADFYFMGQSLSFLPKLLALSKRRQYVVRCAFIFAIGYNFTAIAICLNGHMSPLLAAILMPLSSVISLAIVSLGLRGWGAKNRKVDIGTDNSYPGVQGVPPPDSNHVPGPERLRPHAI
jgi:P-type Cu2+ transporter